MTTLTDGDLRCNAKPCPDCDLGRKPGIVDRLEALAAYSDDTPRFVAEHLLAIAANLRAADNGGPTNG
jgi:hypothetical protein